MEKMREEFEAWAIGDVNLDISTYSDGGYYRSIHTVIAWDAWQASRAALCVNLPDSERSVECGDVLYRSDVEQSLEDTGVRYK